MFRKYIYNPIELLIDNDLFELSGYIAYAALLSFFPFVIIMVSVATIFGAAEISAAVLKQIYSFFPQQVASQIAPVAQQIIDSHQGKALTFSTIMVVWAASSGIEAIRTALNRVNSTIETRSIYLRKFQNIFFMFVSIIGMILIGGFMIALPMGLQHVVDYCPIWLVNICNLQDFRYPVSFCVMFITFSLMYKLLPCDGPSFRSCLPGALISSTLWVLLAYCFSLYIKNFASYNILYGSLAGIIITLIFLHFSAFIMLYGAELNAVLRVQQHR